MARQPYDYQPILNFIQAYTVDNGYPPTLREIGKAMGMTKTAAFYHIDNLCDLGVLSKKVNSPRSIMVINNVNPSTISGYDSNPTPRHPLNRLERW